MAKKVYPIDWKEIPSFSWLGHWDRYPRCRYCDEDATHMVRLTYGMMTPFCERHVNKVAPKPGTPMLGMIPGNPINQQEVEEAIERDRQIRARIGGE